MIITQGLGHDGDIEVSGFEIALDLASEVGTNIDVDEILVAVNINENTVEVSVN